MPYHDGAYAAFQGDPDDLQRGHLPAQSTNWSSGWLLDQSIRELIADSADLSVPSFDVRPALR
jgi:hypothetical protein